MFPRAMVSCGRIQTPGQEAIPPWLQHIQALVRYSPGRRLSLSNKYVVITRCGATPVLLLVSSELLAGESMMEYQKTAHRWQAVHAIHSHRETPVTVVYCLSP